MAKKPTSENPSSGNRDEAAAVAGSTTAGEDTAPAPEREAGAEHGTSNATEDAAQGDAPAPDAVGPIPDESSGKGSGDDAEPDDTAQLPAPPPPVATEQVVIRKGGAVPLLLGGVLAGAIGFGAGYYLAANGTLATPADIAALKAETAQGLAAQSDRLDTIEGRLGEPPDLAALETGQAGLRDDLDALAERVDAVQGRLGDLADKVESLAARPLADGASDAASAAYDAELKKLQQAMAEQRAEIAAMTARAQEKEASAEETAQATMRRAALTRILTALDTGGGYADALGDLNATGAEVPEILAESAPSGVVTLAQLQARFPDAARSALAAARTAAAERGETGGLGAFLRNQLGARSLTPREGNDPDAILSRAEAAVRDGRLTDALAEIKTLPDPARNALAQWADEARHRLEVVAAAQKLSEELN